MSLYEEVVKELRRIQGGISVSSLSSRLRFGDHRSMFKEQGHDFYQLREYDPERDSVERIVWDQAAQAGDELYVREAIEPKDFPVYLLVDLSSSIDFSEDKGIFPKRKLLLECAGSLGLTAAHIQDRVGLIGFTDRIILDEPPRSGNNQVYYLLSRLCDFFENAPKNKSRQTDFWTVLDLIRKRSRGPTLILILSDFIGWEKIADSPFIARRNAHHEFVFLILHDPNEFSIKNRLGYVRIKNMETGDIEVVSVRKLRAMHAEALKAREAFRAKLKKTGVDSIVLTYGNHFEQLAKFFAERREGA